MHSSPDCLPCAIRQVRQIVRLTGGDSDLAERVLGYLSGSFEHLDLADPPSTYTSHVLLAAMELLDNPDPFKAVKQEQNETARPVAEVMDRELEKTEEPLKAALALAAAGNVMDSGPGHKYTLEDALEQLRFLRDDSDQLIERLNSARSVMYILDNAGEVMFDRLVLKRLPKSELTIVAKSSPILNDVTLAEARELGLDEFGRVIATGSALLGVDFGSVSADFKTAFHAADVVIAKGHANFESLAHGPRDGFYVLKTKCDLVAGELGVRTGESVCYYAKESRNRGIKESGGADLESSNPGILESSLR